MLLKTVTYRQIIKKVGRSIVYLDGKHVTSLVSQYDLVSHDISVLSVLVANILTVIFTTTTDIFQLNSMNNNNPQVGNSSFSTNSTNNY